MFETLMAVESKLIERGYDRVEHKNITCHDPRPGLVAAACRKGIAALAHVSRLAWPERFGETRAQAVVVVAHHLLPRSVRKANCEYWCGKAMADALFERDRN